MYKFIDINERQMSNMLPSEAMTFNGKIFENEIRGYRTLNVSGREILSTNIRDEDVDGRDGTLFMTANYQKRFITVKYRLTATSSADFREKYNQLNILLSMREATFSFADEPSYQFVGTLSDASSPGEGKLSVISEFTIQCSDPYKHKLPESIIGTGIVNITTDLPYETLPTEIKVTPTAQTNTIAIKNVTQNKTITITDTFLINIPISLYPQTQKIIRNTINYPNFLNWVSDFENFTINKGDVITVTPSCKLEIKVRRKVV